MLGLAFENILGVFSVPIQKNLPMKFMQSILLLFLLSFIPATGFAQCWNLVWEDEFTGNQLNSNWTYQTGGNGWGNNELQAYTNRPENTTVANGYLNIIARAENYNGADYTSARIRTINNGDWRYGKMEARIKTPVTQGIWPAFWMMPTDNVYGTWPSSGEIDIMEQLGHQTHISYGTAHWGIDYNNKGSSGNTITNPNGNYSDDFYTYSIEWEPGQIRWYLDGVLFHTLNESDVVAPFTWPFDEKFHFILNIAVGGNWPGAPDNSTVWPQTMQVDYVKVYQLLNNIVIDGKKSVEPAASNTTYSVPSLNNTSYAWSVPNGATIISGAGTNEITVDWANTAGDISVDISNPCGSTTSVFPVYVTPNLSPNPGFELNESLWDFNFANGASGDLLINTTDKVLGEKSGCMDVVDLGNNFWDAQLSPEQIELTANEEYKISFWAKANSTNRTMSMAIINSTDYTYYAGTGLTINDQWNYYEYIFTAPVTASSSINLDLGYEIGETCFDEFFFGRNEMLPAALTDFDLQATSVEIWVDENENLFVLKGNLGLYQIQVLDANEQVLFTYNNGPDELLIERSHLGAGLFFIRVQNLASGDVWVQQIINSF